MNKFSSFKMFINNKEIKYLDQLQKIIQDIDNQDQIIGDEAGFALYLAYKKGAIAYNINEAPEVVFENEQNVFKQKTNWNNITSKYLGFKNESFDNYFAGIYNEPKFIKIVHTITDCKMEQFIKKYANIQFVDYSRDVKPVIISYKNINYDLSKPDQLLAILSIFWDVKNFEPSKMKMAASNNYNFSPQQFLGLFFLIANGYRPILIKSDGSTRNFMDLDNHFRYPTDVLIAREDFSDFTDLVAFM